jgi:hypothetical protein
MKTPKIEKVTIGEVIDFIEEAQKCSCWLYRNALKKDFLNVLTKLEPTSYITLDILQGRSKAFQLLNVFGVLYSLHEDPNIKKDVVLNLRLDTLISRIEHAFPNINTSYDKQTPFETSKSVMNKV